VQDLRGGGLANGKAAILIIIFRQPARTLSRPSTMSGHDAAITSVDPPAIKLEVLNDRTSTIRASVEDVEISLLISVSGDSGCFIFLRSVWATIIPSVAVPLSLLGTFGACICWGTASTICR